LSSQASLFNERSSPRKRRDRGTDRDFPSPLASQIRWSRLVRHGQSLGVHHAVISQYPGQLVGVPSAQPASASHLRHRQPLRGITCRSARSSSPPWPSRRQEPAAQPVSSPNRRPGGRGRATTPSRVVVQSPESTHRRNNEVHWPMPLLSQDRRRRRAFSRRFVRRIPPEWTISWAIPTFDRSSGASLIRSRSIFTVTQRWCSTFLDRNRGRARVPAMKHLLTDQTTMTGQARKHIHRSIEIYRALLAGGVVEQPGQPD